MTTPVYTITSARCVTVFRRQQTQAAYNLYNTSPVASGPPIYLDDSPQAAGTTTGVPLYPGAMLRWEAGRECYAITPAGTSGQLTASPNNGAYYDPYSLAINLLSLNVGGQTLAQQIAANIYITGAPPVDKQTLLLDANLNQDGVTHQLPAAGSYDTSAYQSLAWRWHADDPATVGVPGAANFIGFYWYDLTGVSIAQDIITPFGDDNRATGFEYSFGRLQVRGPRLVVLVIPQSGIGGTARLTIDGSLRAVSRNSSWLGNGFYGHTTNTVSSLGLDRYVSVLTPAAMLSGANTTEWIPTRSGRVSALFTYNATVPANGLDFLVQDLDGVPIAGQRAIGAGAAAVTLLQQFVMPDRPQSIFMRNKGPAALVPSMQAQFVWEAD